VGGVRFVLANQLERLSGVAAEPQGDAHAKPHPLRDAAGPTTRALARRALQ